MAKEINTPWEDDEIEFLPGDWTIERAESVGFYNYSENGIEGYCSVDAFQLLQWHMARPTVYPELTPWEGSDITFVGDKEILRDLRDTSKPVGDRKYLLLLDSGDFSCVDKYYLIQKKLAQGGEKVAAELAKVNLDIARGTEGVVWDCDDIVLTPRRGMIISRAAVEGKYRVVTSDGMSSVRSADSLIASNLAQHTTEARLDILATYSQIWYRTLRSDLCNFWYSATTETLSPRDIARLHYYLEQGSGAHLESLVDEYKKAMEELEKANSNLPEMAANFNRMVEEVKQSAEEAKKNSVQLKYTVFKELIPQTDYSNSEELFGEAKNLIKQVQKKIADLLKTAKKFNSSSVGSSVSIPEHNLSIFPPKAERIISEAKKKLLEAIDEQKKLVASLDDISAVSKQLDTLKREMESHLNELNSFELEVEAAKARKNKLDEVASQLGNEAQKPKKYLFNKTFKEDRIRYTTALRITSLNNGQYIVPYAFIKAITVTADELIYLRLAVHI